MLIWCIKIIIISVIIIFLTHNIITFMSDTLTVPKTKDLVQITNKNYENIYNILSYSKNDYNHENMNDSTPIYLLPTTEINISQLENNFTDNSNLDSNLDLESNSNIKEELKNYLHQQIIN